MKKLNYGVMIVAAGMLFQACHSNSSSTAADSGKMKDSTTAGKVGMTVGSDDARFAIDAANGGMTEIELSKLAITKASNAAVKEFAHMMVVDHSAAGEQLKAVAKAKNIALSDSVDTSSKEAIADMAKKSGADFDKAYVDKMAADHKGAVDVFENASKTLKDADLKAFVDKTLPVIRGHLEHITKIKAGMK